MDPHRQPIQDNILKVKYGYFDTAKSLSDHVLAMSAEKVRDESSDEVTVFNTDSWARTGLVAVKKEDRGNFGRIFDSSGNEIPCQILSSGDLVFIAKDVPALGCLKFRLVEGNYLCPAMLQARSTTYLDNGIINLRIDPESGDVYSIIMDGEEFVNKQDMAGINSFRYLQGSNSSGRALKPTNVRLAIGENGPIVNSIIIESDAAGCNGLIREVSLIKGSQSIEFKNTVDKMDIQDKEGIHFGYAFNVPNSTVRVNIPWGIMELEKDQLPSANRNWIAVERWLDVSNSSKGVTWCPLNAVSLESGDMTANIIGGAFESPAWITRLQPSSTIYSWALNNHWHTNFPLSQSGEISYKYRLMPHNGAFDVTASNRFAVEQFRPLIAVKTVKGFSMSGRMFIKGSDKVSLSSYRTVDDGHTSIVRLLSMSEADEAMTISWGKQKPRSVTYSQEGKEVKISPKKTEFTIPKRGIITLKVNWK